MKYASDAYLAALDRKADEMWEKIMNTASEYEAKGRIYYVSENGNDEADGLSEDTAWKTPAKVGEAELNEGDVVLFKRGEIFRGILKTKPGVTYSAYGEGEKPGLYGFCENAAGADKWVLDDAENHIWRYYAKVEEIGGIVFEDEFAALKLIPYFGDGAYRVSKETMELFDYRRALDEDYKFFVDLSENIDERTGMPKLGLEFKGNLYLRLSEGNPGELYSSIEFLSRHNGVAVGTNNNVTVDNLSIKYIGCHGVGAGTVDGLTVRNCEIGWIGGAIQHYNATNEWIGTTTRFGNGVEIYGGCHNYTVKNNWIYECYDAGITHQVRGTGRYIEMFDVTYADNLIENCVYNIEYFLSRLEEGNKSLMKNILIRGNFMRFSGFGWGHQRPNKGCCAHIKGWDSTNPAENYVIEDNVFDRSRWMMFHIGTGDEKSLPVLRNNTYVQYKDAQFGRFAKVPTEMLMFNADAEEAVMKNVLHEENADVYFVN